jgi:hypothetical protein
MVSSTGTRKLAIHGVETIPIASPTPRRIAATGGRSRVQVSSMSETCSGKRSRSVLHVRGSTNSFLVTERTPEAAYTGA